MDILAIGLNHETSEVELRERVAISDLDLDLVLDDVRKASSILESVILSTCNRTEVYAVVSSYKAGQDYFQTLLARRAGMTRREIADHLYVHCGQAAVRHLFKVAAGLDSMVLGETQILGQVRSAYLTSRDAGNTGMLFERLFRESITLGKRAQSETEIGQRPVSVSYAAIQLAKKVFGHLQGRRAVLIGAGKMAALAAEHLAASGIGSLSVVNRTYERAASLAARFGGQAIPMENLRNALAGADIVLSSTGAPGPVIGFEDAAAAATARGGRPAVYLDIAVPRDMDAAISEVKNVFLYDIDDLKGVIDANLAERARAAEAVEVMIGESLRAYSEWLSQQEVVPLITAVRAKGTQIQADVMASLERKLPNLSEHDLKLIHKHTMSIVNQLLRDPVHHMKELAAAGQAQYVGLFAQLFGITDEQWQEAIGTNPLAATDMQVDTPRGTQGFIDLVRRLGQVMRIDEVADDSSGENLHPVLR